MSDEMRAALAKAGVGATTDRVSTKELFEMLAPSLAGPRLSYLIRRLGATVPASLGPQLIELAHQVAEDAEPGVDGPTALAAKIKLVLDDNPRFRDPNNVHSTAATASVLGGAFEELLRHGRPQATCPN